jgi:hypothetical protein
MRNESLQDGLSQGSYDIHDIHGIHDIHDIHGITAFP